MTATVHIDPRYCGPPGSGNGGFACGLLAATLPPGPVEVALRLPPPLARPLTLATAGGEARLLDGDVVVATARAVSDDLDAGPPVSLTEARAAVDAFDLVAYDARHPYATCFTCGPGREPGDGLRIFPAPHAGTDAVVWTWRAADAGFDDPVPLPVLWAALDCPGGMAWLERETIGPAVLGRLAVEIVRTPTAAEEMIVTGWRTGRDGRNLGAGTALRTATGDLIAVGRATWIELTSEQAATFASA